MTGEDIDATSALFAEDGKSEFIAELTASGHRVIELPVPRITPVAGAELRPFDEIDWIVFAGAESASSFLDHASRALEESADSIRVAAIGSGPSELLRDRLIHCDVVSENSPPDAVISEVEAYESGLAEVSVLIVGGDWEAPAIASSFAAAGAKTSAFIACTANFEDAAAVSRIRTLALGGAIDRFCVDSPDEVDMIRVLFAGDLLAELLPDAVFDCADVRTALRLGELGVSSASIRIRAKKDGHGEP